MASSLDPGPEKRVLSLYDQLLNCWNSGDAMGFAALFTEDGEAVGFDGSQHVGRQEIGATLRHIFASHPTGAYVPIVRTLRFPTPDIALLRAEVGMIPAGEQDIAPALNAVQGLAAVRTDSGWRIASFQNTPAQFHGRPDLAEALTAELREKLRRASARRWTACYPLTGSSGKRVGRFALDPQLLIDLLHIAVELA